MYRNKLCIVLFAVVLTVCCVGKVASQIYYPTNLGNVWVLETDDKTERITYSIDASEESINGIELSLLKISSETVGTDSILTEKYFVDFDEEGIKLYKYVVELGSVFGVATGLFYPPILFYPLSPQLNEPWEYTTETDVDFVGPVTFTSVSEVIAVEDVVTPAGTFEDCIKVKIRTRSQAATISRSTSYQWLAPDFGPVKFENSQNLVFKLVSSNLLSDVSTYDVTGDGVINILDLVFVASRFGEESEEADVNDDGKVNILDLVLIAQNFSV
ncbi:MAG: hypothetical protein OXD54_01135 [Candidatus Poribacteria bacterium]|nr:hypothetical protein [Candidatus Poribacteria bacterium]